jgi:hypothetical protein
MRIRTRKREGRLLCSITIPTQPNPLKPALPKKLSAYARKPSCFHLALYEKRFCAKPANAKQALM